MKTPIRTGLIGADLSLRAGMVTGILILPAP